MPSWRPDCFRGSVYEPYPIKLRPAEDVVTGRQDIDEDRRGIAVVELHKKEGCGLGLIISGGTDKQIRPQITNLRPGSIAHRSDSLTVGDYILSVNGIRTASLKHDEIINLLKNAGERIILEVEYEIPETAQTSFSVQSKCHDLSLDKDSTGFGFIIRGGMDVDRMRAHPHTVTAIRPGGAADREGSIKEGDRILAVNNYKVCHLSLSETMSLLQQCESETVFTVEYDVSVMDSVQNASGPLLIEIDKIPGSALGIALSQSSHEGRSCVCVDVIRPMSIADRSGALHVGDHILSIDGASVEHMSVVEASQLLKSGPEDHIKLEILPVTHLEYKASREKLGRPCTSLVPALSSPTISSSIHNGFGTLPIRSSNTMTVSTSSTFGTLPGRRVAKLQKAWTRSDRKISSCMSIASTTTSVLTTNNQVCHTETTEVILFCDKKGLGITLDGGVFSTTPLTEPPIIAMVEPMGPADKCGVVQEGDRILTINGVDLEDKTLEEVNQLLRDSRPRCMMEIEFDVAESVTPSSGTYVVRIPKKNGGLGMTIIASTHRKHGDPLIITGVRKGSVAYRCGSVQPGDKLLAVNDIRMDNCSIEDATHLLESSDEIIKLKLRREDPYSEDGHDESITYTVELQRFGGPLGITITGTEDPLDPIVISALIEGGLAEKTGAIHVGDNLLAINGKMTRGKRLSEAIRMLQTAGDIVVLKIARPLTQTSKQKLAHSYDDDTSKRSTPIPSVDSALESWDSSGQDIGNSNPNGHALVVAIPQRRPKKLDSTRRVSGHSALDMEGSGEGMADMQLSEDDWGNDSHSSDSYSSNGDADEWMQTLKDFEKGSGSEMLRQIGLTLRERSTASLDRRSRTSDDTDRVRRRKFHRMDRDDVSQDSMDSYQPRNGKSCSKDSLANSKTIQEHMQTIFTPTPIQLHRVVVTKHSAVEDFGFSLSDGMYEKGVFISAIRPNSPAHRAGLKSYDRILQVNKVRTRDFDCCLTIPLIAEAGNKLRLVICRNPLLRASRATRESCLMDTEHSQIDPSQITQASDQSVKTV
ncbi:glutamate receptor-interacting protein 1-like [Gigantopelta aegis]|uniref:glutamate receptor-interacting protein 1-like n=1 Tax=Gigantopelta aegis TaxID=1735272 RepID=UPI001B88AD69|nr:glutamate receptor-interacting protein 1-like [Gigantopelta aegis]